MRAVLLLLCVLALAPPALGDTIDLQNPDEVERRGTCIAASLQGASITLADCMPALP